jgi:alpha-methylacyl-CoA racemase
MEGSDVCFAPVLSMGEAPEHPHNVHRATFIDHGGAVQAAPAPHIAQDTDTVLADHGFSPEEIGKLRETGAVK